MGIIDLNEPAVAISLAKTFMATDFTDSGTTSTSETQALLPLFGQETVINALTSRYRDIAKSLTYTDVAAVNIGNNKAGDTEKAFSNVSASTADEAKNIFLIAVLVAAAIKAYKSNATYGGTGFDTLANATQTFSNYLAQAVAPGFGSAWATKYQSFSVGDLAMKIKVTAGAPGKFTIAEMLSTDSSYAETSVVSHPNHTLGDDIGSARAIRNNNASNVLKTTDIPDGFFGVAAAIYLANGIDTTSGLQSLATITTAPQVLAITSLVTKVSAGGLINDILAITVPTGGAMPKSAIGDASDSDPRLATGIKGLTINAAYAYASSSPLAQRSIDFVNDPVYQYSSKVTKLLRFAKICKKTIPDLAAIFLSNDTNSSDVKTDLTSTLAEDVKATAYTTSSVTTTVTSKDKSYSNVLAAVQGAVQTGPTDPLALTTSQGLAEFFGNNGTGANVTQAAAATTSPTTGINALEGSFSTFMTAFAGATKPTVSLDIIFEAIKLLAKQNNSTRGAYDDVYKIISTWFPTGSNNPQVPTTVPVTTSTLFWNVPGNGIYTEEHAKRLFARYVAVNYSFRFLSDSRNKSYFNLLFKPGTNTGSTVNQLQATQIFGYEPDLITGNVPNTSKIGNGTEVYAALEENPDLSTFTKIRLFIEIVQGTVSTSDKLMTLLGKFTKKVIYEMTESPVSKGGLELLVPSSGNAANRFSNSNNIPSGTSYYATYSSNTDAHKAAVKRGKILALFMDLHNSSENNSLAGNRMLELYQTASDFLPVFVKLHTNYGTNNSGIFTGVIQTWLKCDLSTQIQTIVTSSYTYGSISKDAIKNYISSDLGLSGKSLPLASDTITQNNTSLITPTLSTAVKNAATLASKVRSKDVNLDDPSKSDTKLKLGDFLGTSGKQDQILPGLIAALEDGKDDTKLSTVGRNLLLEAGMSSSDISLLVISKYLRSDPWLQSNSIQYQFLSGSDNLGTFVSE